jgi:hypothetical protein
MLSTSVVLVGVDGLVLVDGAWLGSRLAHVLFRLLREDLDDMLIRPLLVSLSNPFSATEALLGFRSIGATFAGWVWITGDNLVFPSFSVPERGILKEFVLSSLGNADIENFAAA